MTAAGQPGDGATVARMELLTLTLGGTPWGLLGGLSVVAAVRIAVRAPAPHPADGGSSRSSIDK